MNLELKVPPPIVVLILAVLMWALAKVTPQLALPDSLRVAAGLLLIGAGLAITVAGVMAVRRFKTTFNPLRPDTTTALVSTGLFGISRNPMYLGFLVVLLGWAAYLASPCALIGPVVFVLYITRFQIVPEERALSSLFGARFDEYKAKVRRWL